MIFGDWLFERREFVQAASGMMSLNQFYQRCANPIEAFVQAKSLSKAMVAHEKALQWQDLFDIAVRLERSDDELKVIAYRLSGMSDSPDVVYIAHISASLSRGSILKEALFRECQSAA